MEVRLARGEELTDARRRLNQIWDNPIIVRGAAYDLMTLPCLIAGDFEGIAAFSVEAPPLVELVALNAMPPGKGAGTALIAALAASLGPGFSKIRLSTTNDNLDALRFYQRRGFRLAALRPDALAASRSLKPSIPLVGDYGIPLRDEIDLVLDVGGTG
jgi:hypothetical protein